MAGTVLPRTIYCGMIPLVSTLGETTAWVDKLGVRMMRCLVTVLGLALVIVQAAQPGTLVNEISLVLFVLAGLALFWRDVALMAGVDCRIELWELEVEPSEKIGRLSEGA